MSKVKKLFCVVFFISLSFASESQTYPLPSSGAKWNIVLTNGTFLCTVKYEYIKDTFMCGYNYAVISNQNQTSCGWWSPILLRSVGNLVYGRVNNCISNEQLLYNFNLNLGDTFIVAANLNDTSVVTNVSYPTMLDGSIRKQITLNSIGTISWQYNWIEGIGDLTSLYYKYNPPDPELDLLCFEDSTSLIFTNAFWNTCDTSTLTTDNENNIISSLFIVYPNPTYSTILIKYSVGLKGNITLRDVTGRVLKSYSLKSYSGTISIPENDLPSGLFFCTLDDNDKHIFTKKIIKFKKNEIKN